MNVNFGNNDCELVFDEYYNGRTRIRLVDASDGEDVATATVNLPDLEIPAGFVAVKDYSENEGMLEALVKAGVVGEPATFAQGGYVQIPICPLLKRE